MCGSVVPGLHLLQDLNVLVQDKGNPPFESGFINQPIPFCILSQLNGVGLLQVLELVPLGGLILKSDEEFPALGCLGALLISLSSPWNCFFGLPMVYDFVQ